MEEFSSVEPRDIGMPFEALTEKVINKEYYIQKKNHSSNVKMK